MRMIHLKEEGLEIVGHVGDDEEEYGRNVDGEDGAQQSSGENVSYFDDIGKMFEQFWADCILHFYILTFLTFDSVDIIDIWYC